MCRPSDCRRGFDVVFDTIGGNNLQASFTATAHEGRIAETNARTTQDMSQLHAKAISLSVVSRKVQSRTAVLNTPHLDRRGGHGCFVSEEALTYLPGKSAISIELIANNNR